MLVHEGGYAADRRDPGNWTGGKFGVGELKGTKKGIAAASYPHIDIKILTDAKIAEIDEANYWRKIRGDELPAGADLSAMDYSVNSGVSRSAKELQRVVGVTVGPATVLATKAMDARIIIKGHCCPPDEPPALPCYLEHRRQGLVDARGSRGQCRRKGFVVVSSRYQHRGRCQGGPR